MTEQPKQSEEISEVEAGDEEDDLSVSDEFRQLYADTGLLKEKWQKLVSSKESSHPEIAAVYRNLAGDLLPLLLDVLQASGSAFEEAFISISDLDNQEVVALSDDEVKQLIITSLMNIHAFEQMSEDAPPPAQDQIQHYLGINQRAISMLTEVYGEEIVVEAKAILAKTAASAESEVAAAEGQ